MGLGCNNFGTRLDDKGSAAVVSAALDAGVTLFDTADIYGRGRSEEILGRLLASHRDRVVVATKFGMAMGNGRRGAHPDYVRRAAEDSLRRLRTDRIDLYQLHRPDPDTPIADTLGALDGLVRSGKVREIGCSYFTARELQESARTSAGAALARFVSVQNEYSLVHREPEQEVLAECEGQGLAFLPYYPLASGLLSGKYRRGTATPGGTRLTTNPEWGRRFLTDANLALVERLSAFAAARGHTMLELAISWLLDRPVVASVIAGASTPAQLKANVAAAGWRLTADDRAGIQRVVEKDS